MSTLTINIPESNRTQDIKNAVQYFVQFSEHHPSAMEDILLGMKMRETDNEDTIPLSQFLHLT